MKGKVTHAIKQKRAVLTHEAIFKSLIVRTGLSTTGKKAGVNAKLYRILLHCSVVGQLDANDWIAVHCPETVMFSRIARRKLCYLKQAADAGYIVEVKSRPPTYSLTQKGIDALALLTAGAQAALDRANNICQLW